MTEQVEATPVRATSFARGLGVAAIVGLSAVVICWFERSIGFRSAVFAFELHFVLMTAAFFADRLLAPELDSRRFDVSEREVRIYRRLGVVAFMRILRAVGWTAALRDRRVFDGTRATLASYERATRHGENAHLWLFVLVLAPIAWALARGWWDAALWLGSMNVVFHLYPILLQRLQRARLRALLDRADAQRARRASVH